MSSCDISQCMSDAFKSLNSILYKSRNLLSRSSFCCTQMKLALWFCEWSDPKGPLIAHPNAVLTAYGPVPSLLIISVGCMTCALSFQWAGQQEHQCCELWYAEDGRSWQYLSGMECQFLSQAMLVYVNTDGRSKNTSSLTSYTCILTSSQSDTLFSFSKVVSESLVFLPWFQEIEQEKKCRMSSPSHCQGKHKS